MRIIAGSVKGRRLLGPKTLKIRPALDSVREAIFNILGDVTDLNVLDLYAGPGSVGLEALSRGAQSAIFVDDLPQAIALIHKNLALCRLDHQAEVYQSPVRQALSRLHRRGLSLDLIFVDPPYDQGEVMTTLTQIVHEKILAPGGRVIVEHSPREPVENVPGLQVLSTRKYGQTRITFLTHAAV